MSLTKKPSARSFTQGRTIKAIGAAARKDIAEAHGANVHLLRRGIRPGGIVRLDDARRTPRARGGSASAASPGQFKARGLIGLGYRGMMVRAPAALRAFVDQG